MRHVAVIFGLLMLAGICPALAAEPGGEAEIAALSLEARQTYSEFMEVTMGQRLHFEFFGDVDRGEADMPAELSKQVSGRFAAIAASQEALSAKIEEYPGDDWEKRYGSTGLWRRLRAEICRTRMFECEARYWLAISAGGAARQDILSDTAGRITALAQQCDSRSLRLLEAKVLLAADKKDTARRRKGADILRELCTDPQRDRVYLAAMLLRYRQAPVRDAEELEAAWIALGAGIEIDDELRLDMAFAGWSAGRQGWLEEAIGKCPQSRVFVGRCVLTEAKRRLATDGVDWVGPYAAGLAAETAMADVHKHKPLLDALGGVKAYRGAGVLRAMAEATEDEQPRRAAELLLEASRLMDGEDAVWAARRAAGLAYAEFCKDKSWCRPAQDVTRNYLDIAGDSAVPEIRYCYYVMLRECGDANQARSMLERIAGGESGEYRKRAAYELSVVRAGESLTAGRPGDAARELATALSDKSGENAELAMEIVSLYLERQEEYQAQAGSDETLRSCRLLAKYCATWMQGSQKYRATLMLAETSLMGDSIGDVAALEEMVDRAASQPGSSDRDLTRCRARMLMAKGDWPQAAAQWGLLCQYTIGDSKGDARSWQWWRAKYYQLLCWSKDAGATKEELARRIEVIRNSCGPVPPLWDARLKTL